jgi:hypothetical protein
MNFGCIHGSIITPNLNLSLAEHANPLAKNGSEGNFVFAAPVQSGLREIRV